MMRWLQPCLQLKVTADSGFASRSVLQHSILSNDALQCTVCLLNPIAWDCCAAFSAPHTEHAQQTSRMLPTVFALPGLQVLT